MTELIEILTTKLNNVQILYNNLCELENSFRKLEDSERRDLPKFKGNFDEKSLRKYLEELAQAVKNPIRFKRKRALIDLGISGVENLKDEVFDDDSIEETIQILKELRAYERLFKIVSSKISPWIIQSSINGVNSQLKDIRDNIERLKKIEEIRSEDVKDYILQKYINGELSVYQIDEFKDNVLKVEKMLNLLIKESEIPLVSATHELIKEIEELGGKIEEEYSCLNDARDGLEKVKENLKQQYKKIRDEINFWQKISPDVYVPDSRNIETLRSKLEELKDKCRKEYNSFNVLEQLYSQKLYNQIENLKDFAHHLDKVISYLPDIEIKSGADIGIVRKLYDQISWLERIEYPKIKELFEGLAFVDDKKFFDKVEEIKKEYERLKRDLSAYQRILRVREEQIDKYPSLKQKIDEYKKELQNKIGGGFEPLIGFLKGDKEDVEADEETLRNFIRTIKPILREVLKL